MAPAPADSARPQAPVDRSATVTTLATELNTPRGLTFAVSAPGAAGHAPAPLTPAVRYAVNTSTDIAYGPKPYEVLDECLPVGAPAGRPGIIMLHGGGWNTGDKYRYEYNGMCHDYAAEGYVVAAVNYRLTPTYQWTDQIGDVQLAVRYMRRTASKTGLDVNRLCALGDSAGAHLALLLDEVRTNHTADVASIYAGVSPKVQCAVDQFDPSDLARLYNENTSNYVRTCLTYLLDYQTPTSNPAIYADASPVNYITAQTGQALIIQGTQDTTVLPDQSQEMQQGLQNAGIPVQYISYNGGHEYGGLTQQQINAIMTQIDSFIRSVEPP